MILLKKADYPGSYHGFSLKEGFWYGTDTETNQPVATSGWESNGDVAIYHLQPEGKWEMSWISVEETDFQIENLPEVTAEGKLSFKEWLQEEHGISWNEWDELYSHGDAGREIEYEYDHYLYDGLPRFVQKYL